MHEDRSVIVVMYAIILRTVFVFIIKSFYLLQYLVSFLIKVSNLIQIVSILNQLKKEKACGGRYSGKLFIIYWKTMMSKG